jgi:hypothetical protein
MVRFYDAKVASEPEPGGTQAFAAPAVFAADLGEYGSVEVNPGGRVLLRYFARPLERGVILVGRGAVLDVRDLANAADHWREYADWASEVEYL